MHKRFLCLLTCLAMVLALLPGTALAAAPTGVWVGGTDVIGGTYYLNDGAGGITSDGATGVNYNVYYSGGTLYLNDAFITKSKSLTTYTAAVCADGDLTIALTGHSVLRGKDNVSNSCGVYCIGDLAIQGDGSLITIGGTATAESCGVYSSGAVSLQGTATVTATGGTAIGDAANRINGTSYTAYTATA